MDIHVIHDTPVCQHRCGLSDFPDRTLIKHPEDEFCFYRGVSICNLCDFNWNVGGKGKKGVEVDACVDGKTEHKHATKDFKDVTATCGACMRHAL